VGIFDTVNNFGCFRVETRRHFRVFWLFHAGIFTSEKYLQFRTPLSPCSEDLDLTRIL
jgi:hypothetical protein